MTMSRLLAETRAAIPMEAVVASSSGNTQAQILQEFPFEVPRTCLTTGGFSTMGWTLPAAMGAKLAAPERLAIGILGDGDFLMGIQELATAVQHDIPVVMIVANNLVRAFGLAGALAMIRYRTRMQDPKDTTMVFFAIIIGMACGLHQYNIAIVGSVFIGVVLGVIKLVDIYTSVGFKNGIKEIDGGENGGTPTEIGENSNDNTQGAITQGDDRSPSNASEENNDNTPGDQPGSPGPG